MCSTQKTKGYSMPRAQTDHKQKAFAKLAKNVKDQSNNSSVKSASNVMKVYNCGKPFELT